MRHFAMSVALVATLAVAPAVRAHDAYDDSESHPLRLAAYVLHPIGWAAEWLVMRPIHFVASQPGVEPISGHVPHESAYGDYRPYRHSSGR